MENILNNPEFITWDNDIRKYIGKQIAEMRKGAGLSQVELAEKSGVGHSHIARIEVGKYSVGIDTLQKIADVFGKRIDFVGNNTFADTVLSEQALLNLGFIDMGVKMDNMRLFKKGDTNIAIDTNNVYYFQMKTRDHFEVIKNYDHLARLILFENSKTKPILQHISGVKGVFIKKYTPTGQCENIMIECSDGLKFHAPANEFNELVSQNPHEEK